MDESSSAIHTLVHILKSIYSLNWTRYLSYIAATLALPLRIAWIPLSYVFAILKAIFAPAGYILSYLGGWVAAIANFLVSLEPLYTFFSVAAFIGILAGIIMAVASAILTTYFNMQDEPEDTTQQEREALTYKKQMYLQQQYLRRDPQGLEPDWHWADTSPRYRRVSGLQAETILEEDDSEE
ncbi:hypothetical protein VFPPC_09846 [Pochonia chlamydosporia 170]|uniref:Uncharacterized protein n=1 Tax=Pochonia chlamydosporia 170 TaxID=1380566 RepID=A0A179FDN7_METCM|nr:hypothetical protein VFPPC_09846 [Pochonia chlamydosporia 170]OAQ63468.1 hypothetical protein VFPPC_09846 [Pochonia chlamydosporia 170]